MDSLVRKWLHHCRARNDGCTSVYWRKIVNTLVGIHSSYNDSSFKFYVKERVQKFVCFLSNLDFSMVKVI